MNAANPFRIPAWRQLRWNLVFVSLLVAVIPTLIVGGLILSQARARLVENITGELEAVAILKENQLRQWLAQSEYAFDFSTASIDGWLAQNLASPETNLAEMGGSLADILKDVVRITSSFDELFVYTHDGQIIASSKPAAIGKIVRLQPYFQASLTGPYRQSPYYEVGSRDLTMVVTRPLTGGSVPLVIAVRLKLDILDSIMLERAGLGETAETYLVSAETRYLLTPSRFDGFEQLHAYRSEGIENAVAGKPGSGVYAGYRGVPVVGVYRWLPELQVGLLAEEEEAEALSGFNQILQVSLLVVAAAASMAVVATIYNASRVSRPITALTQIASQVAAGNLQQRAQITAKNEVGVLAETFNSMTAQLQDLVSSLEERVAVRTHDLAATLEVGRLATSIASREELLPRLVEFIRASFNLYYTQIYLLDEARRTAILRAGTGDIGRELLARGHQLDLSETSLVARAVQTGQAVLVADTQTSPIHKANPLLPDTRSEITIPLIVGDNIMGVLDMQAVHPGTFNDENLPVFMAMANQIAAVLNSAQAFSEARAATERAEAINQRLTAEAWKPYLGKLSAEERIGYEYDLETTRPVDQALLPDGSSAAEQTQPVMLRGQIIGQIVVRDDRPREWTGEEKSLVRDVSARLAAAFDQYRAFDETRQALKDVSDFKYALDEAAIVAITDQRGIIHYVNDKFVEISKYSREELIGQDHRILNSGYHSKEFIRNLWVTIANGKVWRGQIRNRAKDGSLYWVNTTIVPFMNEQGKPYQYLAIRYEITEQKRQEEEIARRAAELETVAQVSAAASTILDVDTLLQTVSDLTRERFGLYHAHIYLLDERGENLVLAGGAGEAGRLMKERSHRIPADHPHSLVARCARARQSVIVNDVTVEPDFLPNDLLPDTKSELAVPMLVGGELIGVLDVQSERANRFTTEDARVKATLADQIAVAVQNARAYAFQKQVAERLREVDRLKSEFLANMSHELRTPLNSIIGYSEVLLDGIDGELSEDALEDVKAIHGSGQHLLNIINDILDLAKIEAGQMRVDRKPLNLSEFVYEIANAAQILVKNKPVELVVTQEADIPSVYADPVRLRQIIWNLLSNAVKFTEAGSVEIALRLNEEGQAEVKVRDTGIGMRPQDLPKLFEQFRQVDGSSTRRAGGTGLGLHITRHLVRMHGGEIHVTSEYGVGSTFWFTLPLYISETVAN